MKKTITISGSTPIALLLLLLLSVSPASAQVGASEANGTIEDRDGNPVAGATVTFVPQGNPTLEYTGKSNKKGRYFVPGLWTPKEDDRWNITVEAEGFTAVHVRIESRNVNKVLIGDILEQKLSSRSKIPEIGIRPMGKVKVDLKMTPSDALAEEERAEALAAATAGQEGTGAIVDPDSVVPQQDPWNEAITLASTGDLRGSIPFFKEAVEKEPENAERHEAFAKVLYQTDSYDVALVHAQKATELAPERLDALMVLYSIQVGQQDLAGAKATLDKARVLAPQDVRVLQQLAFVATKSGNTADAIQAYQAIVEMSPDNADAWLALGGIYAEAGESLKSEAAYQKVIEISPESSHRTFYNLGVLIMNRKNRSQADTRRAVDAFEQALRIDPTYAQAYQQLAFAQLELGNRSAAKESLEAYVRVSPNAPDASRIKGLIKTLSQ